MTNKDPNHGLDPQTYEFVDGWAKYCADLYLAGWDPDAPDPEDICPTDMVENNGGKTRKTYH